MSDWKPIETCPYQTVVWVRNRQMKKPVLATRGYVCNGAVHEDNTFFTSVYTSDRFFPTPAGLMVCPEEWRPAPPTGDE